jgi:dTDP-glucose pyrophosphorylase
VNNRYVEWGEMRHHVLTGWWTDAGTVPSLHRASALVAGDRANPLLTGAPASDAIARSREAGAE